MTPARKRIRKSKAERRREIAEAAVKLIGKHGLAGITVSQIAKAVRVSNSALYQHFHDREEVLWAATELVAHRSDGWLFTATGATGFERLTKMGENHLQWATSALDTFVRPAFAMTAGSNKAGMVMYANSAAQRSVDLISSIVEQGQEDGSIQSDIGARDLAWGILMFGWAEDMALLNGAKEATDTGVAQRNFKRFLATFAPPESQPDEQNQADALPELSGSPPMGRG